MKNFKNKTLLVATVATLLFTSSAVMAQGDEKLGETSTSAHMAKPHGHSLGNVEEGVNANLANTSSEHAHKMGNEEEANPIKGKKSVMKAKKMAGASSGVKKNPSHEHQLGNDEEGVNTSTQTATAKHGHKLGDAEEGANTSTKVVTDVHKPQAGQ